MRFRRLNLSVLAALFIIPAMGARAGLDVVVTIKPLHSLVAAVTEGLTEPHLLIRGNASPHTFTMKPSDARALQRAALIFRIGPNLETFMNSSRTLLRSGRVVDLISAQGVATLPLREHFTADDAHSHDHGHDRDAPDPHIWLSPANAIAMVRAISAALSRVDPARMDAFARNAEKTIEKLSHLEARLKTDLAPVRTSPFFVYHDAYQYFEKAFSLNAIGAIALGDSRAPGAKRLRAINAEIKKQNVRCVFVEPQFPPKLAVTLTEGTGARIATLDPVGADLPAGPNAYFDLIQNNVRSLVGCLTR